MSRRSFLSRPALSHHQLVTYNINIIDRDKPRRRRHRRLLWWTMPTPRRQSINQTNKQSINPTSKAKQSKAGSGSFSFSFVRVWWPSPSSSSSSSSWFGPLSGVCAGVPFTCGGGGGARGARVAGGPRTQDPRPGGGRQTKGVIHHSSTSLRLRVRTQHNTTQHKASFHSIPFHSIPFQEVRTMNNEDGTEELTPVLG